MIIWKNKKKVFQIDIALIITFILRFSPTCVVRIAGYIHIQRGQSIDNHLPFIVTQINILGSLDIRRLCHKDSYTD